jgi:hypothetical protein
LGGGVGDLDYFSFLETTAEISIAIAGFVSVFLVLARRDGSFPPEHALTIRSNLLSSVGCLFFAATPLVFAGLGVAGPALWRFSSAVFLFAQGGIAFYMAVNRRKLPSHVQGTVFARIAWGLATLTLIGLVSNVAGWPRSPNAGVYLLTVWFTLGIASVNFLDLVFRGVLRTSK